MNLKGLWVPLIGIIIMAVGLIPLLGGGQLSVFLGLIGTIVVSVGFVRMVAAKLWIKILLGTIIGIVFAVVWFLLWRFYYTYRLF